MSRYGPEKYAGTEKNGWIEFNHFGSYTRKIPADQESIHLIGSTKVPQGLTHVKTLFAQNVQTIPPYLTTLRTLYADKVQRLPDTLINLEYIFCNSLEEVPPTFVKLIRVNAKQDVKIPGGLKELMWVNGERVKPLYVHPWQKG